MGDDAGAQLVLLRFSGDISTKARATRHQFVRRLLHNLNDALASEGFPPRVRVSHNRVFVELPPGADPEVLTRVFGIQSISVVEERAPADVDAIVRLGEPLFRERVRGRRFGVRTRRVGNKKDVPISPGDVDRELGAALLPVSAGVDLDDPEIQVHVELMKGTAYLLRDRSPGPAGLPLGVEGHALALLSGGFDSAVAAWQMLRRGVSLDYLFCNLGGETHRLGALRVAKLVADRWHHGERPELHCVDFGPVVDELRRHTRKRYWQVLLKRLMLRAADLVAADRRAVALVTGEAVGQVSSQTLQNLSVITRAAERMILRPLVGTNKEEIIRLTERIGTFELSKVVDEYCDLVPRRPATGASLEAVEHEEAQMDLSVLERAVAARTVFDLRNLDEARLSIPDIEATHIPEDAVVVDLRTRDQFQTWHHPDAVRLEFSQAVQAWSSFDRSKSYLLYCDFGLLSAHLAEMMRKGGFRAFHWKGGTRALRRKLESGSA
ncbi:MAG: tRNA uracil 4-sulfurtransferase ThiI [Myxococcota bacterium]|nr:tRNA uracil 4-sulfurtransferase ThiI [Myxococcota bacterium]